MKNIYNMHDFIAGTYQHNLNTDSIPTIPMGATAFIDNSSMVNFDSDSSIIEDITNMINIIEDETIITDINDLTIIDCLPEPEHDGFKMAHLSVISKHGFKTRALYTGISRNDLMLSTEV